MGDSSLLPTASGLARLRPYPAYKDSGVPWLGKVPEHWGLQPGKACFQLTQTPNTGMKESQVLSLSYGQIVVKPAERLHGLVPASFETYQVVQPGDIVCRPTDLQNDWNSLRFGLSRHPGIITSAYLCLRPTDGLSKEYGYELLHTYDLLKVFYGLGSGLRQNLDWADFKYLPCLKPSPNEQAAIVRYLNYVDRRTGKYIRAKQKLIKLLEEQKQAIIHRAVTGQIDVRTGKPYPKYRPSGVEWLGGIPEHWGTRRGKTLFSKMDRPVRMQDAVVTCFRDGEVTLRQNRRVRGFTEALKEIGYQGIRRGDLVIHAMDGFAGAIGVADSDGKGSPVYSVCAPRREASAYYYAYTLREMARVGWIQALATGIRERSTDFRFAAFGPQYLPLPTSAEQSAIVRYLDREGRTQDALKDRARREAELLREYRTRLIADVVTGKLDVREVAARLPEGEAESAEETEAEADGDSETTEGEMVTEEVEA